MKGKVAVIGAGIYGVVIAEALARAGAAIDLWERRDDILDEASGQNAFRLHRGYMYSDPQTIEGLAACADRFGSEFESAIRDEVRHYYAVAATGSAVDSKAYEARLGRFGLPFEVVDHPWLLPGVVERCYEVREAVFDRARLRELCRQRLKQAGVMLRPGTEARAGDLAGYDARVIAAYVSGSELGGPAPQALEWVERPVVRFKGFPRASMVLVDGRFINIMPYLDSQDGELFVLGGHPSCARDDSDEVRKRIYQGCAKPDADTCFSQLQRTALATFRDAGQIEHVGSLYGIRSVESKGTRRLAFEASEPLRTIHVRSGKVSYCFDAADRALEHLRAWKILEPSGEH